MLKLETCKIRFLGRKIFFYPNPAEVRDLKTNLGSCRSGLVFSTYLLLISLGNLDQYFEHSTPIIKLRELMQEDI